jgi:hypothetical protein
LGSRGSLMTAPNDAVLPDVLPSGTDKARTCSVCDVETDARFCSYEQQRDQKRQSFSFLVDSDDGLAPNLAQIVRIPPKPTPGSTPWPETDGLRHDPSLHATRCTICRREGSHDGLGVTGRGPSGWPLVSGQGGGSRGATSPYGANSRVSGLSFGE